MRKLSDYAKWKHRDIAPPEIGTYDVVWIADCGCGRGRMCQEAKRVKGYAEFDGISFPAEATHWVYQLPLPRDD